MAPPKGFPKPPTSGRTKGVPNKVDRDVREMILAATHNLGGVKYLEEQGRKNPVAFLSLLGKVLPLQVNGTGNVLLIEQLCVVANAEWQKERKMLPAERAAIDVTPGTVVIDVDEQRHDDGLKDGVDRETRSKAAESLDNGRMPFPPKADNQHEC